MSATSGQIGKPFPVTANPTGLQDPDGNVVPATTDASGNLLVNVAAGGAGDGSILDGVDPAIKATVKDYSNSNPVCVIAVDTNGDPTGGAAVSVADGADVTQGALADAKVVGDNAGSLSAKLRGLNYLWALIVDTGNAWLKVSIQNATLAVTQSGTWVLGAVAVAATVTSVNDSNVNQTLLASAAGRKGFKLYNDSTEIAYVKEGATATTADYSYQIPPQGFYESVGVGVYTGRIDAIWAANGAGAMKITELA